MRLSELQVDAYTQTLADASPAPGGGSASALMGAQGAALTAMVCALTLGRAACAPHHPLAEAARTEAEALRRRFLYVMERDTEAFLTVSAAYAMPKADEAERAARSEAIQQGLMRCTQTPLLMMELSVQALTLTAKLLGKFNQNAASDLGVAALSLRSCAQGAWFNVLINIGMLKDQTLSAQYRGQGEALLSEALSLSEQICQSIADLL